MEQTGKFTQKQVASNLSTALLLLAADQQWHPQPPPPPQLLQQPQCLHATQKVFTIFAMKQNDNGWCLHAGPFLMMAKSWAEFISLQPDTDPIQNCMSDTEIPRPRGENPIVFTDPGNYHINETNNHILVTLLLTNNIDS